MSEVFLEIPPRTISDKVTAQGDSHFICQDYALTGTTAADGEGWAIVADGCSTAPDTDWGARLVAASAAARISRLTCDQEGETEWLSLAEEFFCQTIHGASAKASDLGLSPLALTTTLMIARTSGPDLLLLVYGDGVAALRERATGRWHLRTIKYADGKASYLSYRLSPKTLDIFRGLKDNARSVEKSRWPEETVGELAGPLEPQGDDFSLWVVPVSDYDLALLLSDGATSFTRANPDGYGHRTPVPVEEALANLIDFPLTTPGYLRRSYQYALKQWKKAGWTHYDDLAIAGLYIPVRESAESK